MRLSSFQWTSLVFSKLGSNPRSVNRIPIAARSPFGLGSTLTVANLIIGIAIKRNPRIIPLHPRPQTVFRELLPACSSQVFLSFKTAVRSFRMCVGVGFWNGHRLSELGSSWDGLLSTRGDLRETSEGFFINLFNWTDPQRLLTSYE